MESPRPQTLYERDAVLRDSLGLVSAGSVGRQQIVLLVGGAGLGKTAVLDVARRRAASGTRVLAAAGDPLESAMPFSLAAELVPAADLLPPGGSPEARTVAFHRVLAGLRRGDGPRQVWVLDDLHAADADSLAFLSFVLRRIRGLPLAVLAALRPWPPVAHELALRLASDGLAALHPLQPLSERAAAELLEQRAGRPVDRLTVSMGREATGGNPQLLVQVARAPERGTTAAERLRSWAALVAEAVSLTRFAGVPAANWRFLQAASVLGPCFRPDVAAALAGTAPDAADELVAALGASGILGESATGAVAFVQPLLAASVYGHIPAGLRGRLHVRAFEILAGLGLDRDAAAQAMRADLAGNRDAVAVLERASRQAVAQGSATLAVDWLREAVRLVGPSPRPRLTEALAWALLADGRAAEAVSCCESLLAVAGPTGAGGARLLALLGWSLWDAGRFADARRRLDQACAVAEEEAARSDRRRDRRVDRRLIRRMMRSRIWMAWITGGPAEAVAMAEAALAVPGAAGAGEGGTRARAIDVLVGLHAGRTPSRLVRLGQLVRARAAAAPAGRWVDWGWSWSLLEVHGRAACCTERFAEAGESFRAGIAVARRGPAARTAVSLAEAHADLMLRQGRLEEALGLLDGLAGTGGRGPSDPAVEAWVAALRSVVSFHLGRAEAASAAPGRAAGARVHPDNWYAWLRLADLAGARALRQRRPEEAADRYAEVVAVSRHSGVGEPCLVPWARHALLSFTACGRFDEAGEVLRWVEEAAGRLPCVWPRIAASVGRAALAERNGDRAAADASFRTALALHNEVDLPLERIETLIDFGTFLRRSGKLVAARRHLHEARKAAERTGAAWLGAVVRRELAEAGGRVRTAASSADRLTVSELRVARLVADGASNREIAGALSVSESTVKTHLHRIYGKLGLRSRGQLMASVGPREPVPSSGASLIPEGELLNRQTGVSAS